MKQCCESLYPSYLITHDSNHIQEYHNFKGLKFYGTLHDVIKLVTKWKGFWVFQLANSQKEKKTWRTWGLIFKICCEFIITLGLQQPTTPLGIFTIMYPKGWSNEKRTTKDNFGFLLHL